MKYGKIIGGDYIYKMDDDLSEVESIGGYISVSKGAKLSIPNLTSIGGSISISKDAKLITNKECKYSDKKNDAKYLTKEINFNCFLKNGFLFADGILAKILEVKANIIYKIQIVGKTNVSFCIKKGDVYSHGETIKEARESLIYKISNRDVSKYKNMTLDTVLDFKESVEMYRVITGACENGVKYFVEKNIKTKKQKYKINEIIALTYDQYGNDTLKKYFNKGE